VCCCDLLVKAGAEVDKRDDRQASALHMACAGDHHECAAYLISAGSCIEGKDASGRTPLHVAAEKSATQCVSLLLFEKANPNALDSFGATPLHAYQYKVCFVCLPEFPKKAQRAFVFDTFFFAPFRPSSRSKQYLYTYSTQNPPTRIQQTPSTPRVRVYTLLDPVVHPKRFLG
jgi:hypothetical protein